MISLQGEHSEFNISIVGRHIPEGLNSWENNWLEAECAIRSTEEEIRFCTRRLTVHDVYDLYFHLGIVLQGLSPAGIFVPLLQRQLKLKISPANDDSYQVSLEMLGIPEMEFAANRAALANFAESLHQVLLDYPLRAEEVPSVAPVIEFYSTRQQPERMQLAHGVWGWLRSFFKVSNPLGKGRGDAIRFTFTLSKPAARLESTAIKDFFVARDYRVEQNGGIFKATRGGGRFLHILDGKGLPTQVQFALSDTHSVLTYDVWTAGVRQSSRKLFAWVGEAAMLEVFIAGYKNLDAVHQRLSIMDRNLRRANMRDLLRMGAILAFLLSLLLLTL